MPSTFLKRIYLKRWILICAVEQLHEEEEEEGGGGGGGGGEEEERRRNMMKEKREGEKCGEQGDEVVVDNKEGTVEFGSE